MVAAAILAASAIVLWHWASRAYEHRTRDALKNFGVFADLDYDSVDLSLIPPATHVHGLTIRPVIPAGLTVTIPEAVVRSVRAATGIPPELDVELRGVTLEFKVPPLSGTHPFALVFDEMPRADISLAYEYEPESKDFVLQRFALAAKDLGAIDLSGMISGVASINPPGRTAISQEATGRAVVEALVEAALVRAELRYADRSLLARLALLLAIIRRESAAEAAAEMTELAGRVLHRLPPSEMNEGQALRSFLSSPGHIVLTSEPKVPIPLARFALAAASTFPPLHLHIESNTGVPLLDQVQALAKARVDKLADAAKQARLLGAWGDAADYASAALTLLPHDPVAQAIVKEVAPPPTPSPAIGVPAPSPTQVPFIQPASPGGVSSYPTSRSRWATRNDSSCADWETAPTSCPNGFVHFYLTILSRNDPSVCLAAWEDPPAAAYRLCSRLPFKPHDIRIGSIRTVSHGPNSATLHIDFVDDGVPWRVVAVTVIRGGNNWRIAGWRRRR